MDGFVIEPGGWWWGLASVSAVPVVALVVLTALVLAGLVVLERVGASARGTTGP